MNRAFAAFLRRWPLVAALAAALLCAGPSPLAARQAALVLFAPGGPLAPADEPDAARGVLRPAGEFALRLEAVLRRAGLDPVFVPTPADRIASLLRLEARPYACALFAEEPGGRSGVPDGLTATLPLLRGPRPAVAVRASDAPALRERGSLDALLEDGDLRIGLLRGQPPGPDLEARLHRFGPLGAGADGHAGLAELLRSGRADYALVEREAMLPHLAARTGSTLFPRIALELLDFPDLPPGRVYRLGFTRTTPPDAARRVNEALGATGGH